MYVVWCAYAGARRIGVGAGPTRPRQGRKTETTEYCLVVNYEGYYLVVMWRMHIGGDQVDVSV